MFSRLNPFRSSSRSSGTSPHASSSRDGGQRGAEEGDHDDKSGNPFADPLVDQTPPPAYSATPPPRVGQHSDVPLASSGVSNTAGQYATEDLSEKMSSLQIGDTSDVPLASSSSKSKTAGQSGTEEISEKMSSLQIRDTEDDPDKAKPGALKGKDNDPYAFLAVFDTIFLIDDSSSMEGERWKETETVLEAIVPVCTEYDADGVDVWFLNKTGAVNKYENVKSARVVQRIFRNRTPTGLTFTGARLHEILVPYLCRCEEAMGMDDFQGKGKGRYISPAAPKPINIIMITDGQALDDPAAILLQAASRLDDLCAPPHQVGVQFFQVGDDKQAAKALKELDDNVNKAGNRRARDMVDTCTFDGVNKTLTGAGILQVVLGGVNRRLDNAPVATLREELKLS